MDLCPIDYRNVNLRRLNEVRQQLPEGRNSKATIYVEDNVYRTTKLAMEGATECGLIRINRITSYQCISMEYIFHQRATKTLNVSGCRSKLNLFWLPLWQILQTQRFDFGIRLYSKSRPCWARKWRFKFFFIIFTPHISHSASLGFSGSSSVVVPANSLPIAAHDSVSPEESRDNVAPFR